MHSIVSIAALAAYLTVPSAPRIVAPTGPDHPRAETRLVVAATGNEARYKVREQLAGVDFPNDAIGRTAAVSGGITFDDAGKVIPEKSVITVDVRGLKSDKDRRDGFVQRRLLETEKFPNVTLQVTALNGLPWPLPAEGAHPFTLVGNLTVKGVTKPVTWKVMSVAKPDGYTGTASTLFTFDDFQIEKPRVMVVLSVDDQIALELDFKFVKG